MERDVRYCTTDDGVRIAYSITGEGAPLLACPHLIESFVLDEMMPPYQQFMQALERNATLIRFDMRGTGLSDRNVSDFSLDALVRDIDAVVAAVGTDPVDIWAPIWSVMRGIGYAVQQPERVHNLVLYEAHQSGADAIGGMAGPGLAALARADWRMAAHAVAGSGRAPREHAGTVHMVGEWNRKSASGETFAGLIEAMAETNVADMLHRVIVPTLIVHHGRDRLVKVDVAQKVAAHIPGSRMRVLDGSGPFWGTEDFARDTVEAVHGFLHASNASTPTAQSPSPFRTVLFTDIVGHTEMMQRLGDAKGREVLREHERITRDTLRQHGGAEIKTMGDGFMASFGSVTQAMDCAINLQRAFAVHNESASERLNVRVGLNAGEPIEDEGDLFGSTVILAARIAARADAGDILVPETVRGLLSGKSFLFSDHGEFMPKGFDDAVRLFEVRWQEESG